MQSLADRYRPRDWGEVVGQDKAVGQLVALRDRGRLSGRAFWVVGKSGQGKTTIARLIAAEIASDDWGGVVELDASELTPARLREVEASMGLTAFGKGGRAYIVNEAHGLRRDTVRQLLVMLERLPDHVVFIFTTTHEGEGALFDGVDDAAPLLSRCLKVKLTSQGLAKPFAERAREIAQAEKLDGLAVGAYVALANRERGNMRAMLQAIDAGEMLGGAA